MNFLFLFPDQHRSDWLGQTPGLPLRTPNIDQLRMRGTTFTRAICPSPLCAPSRACIATGRGYANCGVRNNQDDLPVGSKTFYQSLRDGGYHVTGCGKFDLHKASSTWHSDGRTGLAEWGFSDGIDNEGKIDAINSGRDVPSGPYMAFLESRGLRAAHVQDMDRRLADKLASHPSPLPDEAYCDNWIGQNALDLLNKTPVGTPWFMQVNFTGPHNPWDVTSDMHTWYRDATFPDPCGPGALPSSEVNAVRANYAAMIENIDRWVGRLVDAVRQRDEFADTVVVYASDHGEMLGDHNRWGKVVPYQSSLAVPLIIAGPGVLGNVVHQGPATILDLPATFLDYAGLAAPTQAESCTLRPLLEGQSALGRSHVFSALNEWRAVYDGRYKLIENYESSDLLFDLEDDPQECVNLLSKLPDVTQRLRSLLAERPKP